MSRIINIVFIILTGSALLFGQGNSSDINQEGDQNVATVDQTGAGHTADVDQYGRNFSDVDQYGGNNNSATVTQGISGSPVNNYYQPQYSGDWINGAYIEQAGNENTANINMSRSGNGASIYQQGDWNGASQDLGSYYHKTTNPNRMGLDIDQVGDHNYANQQTVSSFGVYGIQGMVIDQNGDYNVATQYSKGGAYSTMEIYQTGNNNNNPTVSGNSFDVSATGLDNPLDLPWTDKPAGDFTQYQNAYKGTAHIDVAGNDNNTAQYQEYTVWSAGGDNDAHIDIIGDGNNVAQGQLGEYNLSDIDIDGNGNVVTTSQHGDNNMADIDLVNMSNNNVAAIEQTGDGHSVSIYQDGANNTAKVIQQ